MPTRSVSSMEKRQIFILPGGEVLGIRVPQLVQHGLDAGLLQHFLGDWVDACFAQERAGLLGGEGLGRKGQERTGENTDRMRVEKRRLIRRGLLDYVNAILQQNGTGYNARSRFAENFLHPLRNEVRSAPAQDAVQGLEGHASFGKGVSSGPSVRAWQGRCHPGRDGSPPGFFGAPVHCETRRPWATARTGSISSSPREVGVSPRGREPAHCR